jgi:hypothetical protein
MFKIQVCLLLDTTTRTAEKKAVNDVDAYQVCMHLGVVHKKTGWPSIVKYVDILGNASTPQH